MRKPDRYSIVRKPMGKDPIPTMLVEVVFDNLPTQFEVIECVKNVPGTPAAREIFYLHDKYPTAAAYMF